MEYDQVIKRNGALTRTPTWVDLENITLRDTRQSRRTRHCMIPCTQNVQNRQIYTNKKIDSSRGWGGGNTADKHGVSRCGDTNVLKLTVVVVTTLNIPKTLTRALEMGETYGM